MSEQELENDQGTEGEQARRPDADAGPSTNDDGAAVFAGTFTAPALGHTSTPIPITGEGTVEIGDSSLRVRGFKAGGFAVLPLLGSMFGAAIGVIAVKLTLFPDLSPAVIGGVIAGGLAAGTAIGRKPSDQAYDLEIPWDRIKKVTRSPTNPKAIMIVIKNFKPKGAIHFLAENDGHDLRGAIERRML